MSESPMRAARELTRPVSVGGVVVGGGAPVSVQSMCTTDTADAAATLEALLGMNARPVQPMNGRTVREC